MVYILGIGISQRRSIKSWLFHKFEPIHPNPYIAGPPIRKSDMFFGREDVFKFIEERFSGTTKNITIVLHGKRRTGKTSILCQIENGRLGDEFIPVYIDLVGMAGATDRGFLARIADKIIESLVKFQVITPESNEYSEINEIIKEYEIGPKPYNVFTDFCDTVLNALKERYLIVMFDHYELFWSKVKFNQFSLDLIQYLRQMIQDRERLAFIFAGWRTFEELDAYWSFMFKPTTYKKVSFLKEKDALALMKEPVGDKIRYDKKAVNKLLRLTACHPYLLQLFLQNLVDHINKVEKYRVKVEEILHILHYIVD
ncbi:MAG: ATP-binding protein, partial [Theionarchaea archaeon]|nr:ATP-binding protein [Theionarchaea archaeon]